MKRPKQHQIEDNAYAQFQTCLPNHWVLRSQTHDYGIDREIEVFKANADGTSESTGYIFKAQVKGTEHVKTSANGQSIKHVLEVNRITYLSEEMKVPVFFVLVDISNKKTWWYAIQLDKGLKQKLTAAIQNKQKSLTLHIPTRNILPETLDSLITTLDDIKMASACDSFVDLPQKHMNNLSLTLDEIENLEQKFTDKIFATKIVRYWEMKDFEGLERVSTDAFSNPGSSTTTKISSILCIERVRENELMGSSALQFELNKLYSKTAETIRDITKNERGSWKLFSAIVWRAALLGDACSKDFAIFLNRQQRKQMTNTDSDILYDVTLGLAGQQAFKTVLKRYNQCLRLITLAINSSEYWILSQVVLRVAATLPRVFVHLWADNLDETANTFREHFRGLLCKTIEISLALKLWDETARLILTAFMINKQTSQTQYMETHKWAIEHINQIDDISRRKVWLDHVNNMSPEFDPEQNALKSQMLEAPTEEEYELFRQMARGLGIDIDNPKDRTGKIVNIGLKDLNPERVLRNCKHLFVYPGNCGSVGEMLKLNTAGSKWLRCLKKRVAVSGLSLDDIYDLIKHEHCSECQDNTPRPTDWKWTRRWQQHESEAEVHEKFISELNNHR